MRGMRILMRWRRLCGFSFFPRMSRYAPDLFWILVESLTFLGGGKASAGREAHATAGWEAGATFFSILAQESFSGRVRLKTLLESVESLSTQK